MNNVVAATGISVVLCTYNGSERIIPTLEALRLQEVQSYLQWEVIVVDNNSSDDTRQVLSSFLITYNTLPIKVVVENKQGLANARQKGVTESQYEYIVFCDDDNHLEKKYLQFAYAIMNRNESIGALGGNIIGRTNATEFPQWWDKYKNAYAVGEQATESGFVKDKMYIWGAGMVTRKSLFLKAYERFPSVLLGRTGSQIVSGEDSEYCIRLLLMGYKLYYDKDLLLTHQIDERRLSLNYLDKLLKSFQENSITTSDYYEAFFSLRKKLFSAYFLSAKSLILYFFYSLIFNKDKSSFNKRRLFFLSNISLGYISPDTKRIKEIATFLNRKAV